MAVWFALLVVGSVTLSAQPRSRFPFHSASVNSRDIAFALAGDLWIVQRGGGQARRLLSSRGGMLNPVFSPNGSDIAFSMVANGNLDAYAIAATGGEPRRLTYHPGTDLVCGWRPDGQSVLVSSDRAADRAAAELRLITVPAAGGRINELPFPRAGTGAFSPDATQIAYTGLPLSPLEVFWRQYRGGAAFSIQIGNLSDSRIEPLPRPASGSNDGLPMWLANQIYFVSDRTGTYNLFEFDRRTRKITQLTSFAGDDIRFASASASGDAIVFIQDGAIHLYDVKTKSHRPVEIRVEDDFPEAQPRDVAVTSWIRSADVSPDQKYVLLEARGEVLKVNLQTGEMENLTQSASAAEHSPRWSPDGSKIAYLSNESGEYQLHIRPAAGAGPSRKIAIEEKPSVYGELVWSPDSTKMALSGHGQRLFHIDVQAGNAHLIDSADHADPNENGFFQPSWSSDSRWLAYSKYLPNHLRGIFVHSLQDGRSVAVTDSRFDARQPRFDANGKFLYFNGSVKQRPRQVRHGGKPVPSGDHQIDLPGHPRQRQRSVARAS
jgi:tricorn protease